VAGRRHLTPLAGRDSAPAVNLAWAAANLLGGALVLRGAAAARQPGRRNDRLVAFEAGYPGLGARARRGNRRWGTTSGTGPTTSRASRWPPRRSASASVMSARSGGGDSGTRQDRRSWWPSGNRPPVVGWGGW
jgi:hypothetical protein